MFIASISHVQNNSTTAGGASNRFSPASIRVPYKNHNTI